MKQLLKAGTTSKNLMIFVQDSSKTTGVGLAGLTSASSGLKWYYYRENARASVAVTLAAQTLGTWTSGGFKEIDATNLPGFYEIGVPNLAIAASASSVVMGLQGATNMVPVNIEVELVAYDPFDSVRLGLTALPNAAAGASGGLPTGNASGQVTVVSNLDKTGYALTQTFPTNFSALAITAGGAVTAGTVSDKTGYSLTQVFPSNFSSLVISGGGAVTAGTVSDKTGYSLTQTFPTNFAALTITSGGAVTAGTVSDKTGYSLLAGQLTVKKNTQVTITFPMFSATTGSLATGLSVTALRSIDGGTVAGTTNSVTEVGSGIYSLVLAAADVNGTVITVIATATGAQDQAMTFITQA